MTNNLIGKYLSTQKNSIFIGTTHTSHFLFLESKRPAIKPIQIGKWEIKRNGREESTSFLRNIWKDIRSPGLYNLIVCQSACLLIFVAIHASDFFADAEFDVFLLARYFNVGMYV